MAAPGTSDPDVLAWAAREARILLTFDKDFGELARDFGFAGCVRGQFVSHANAGTLEVGRRLADLIMASDDWAGHFFVAEPGCIRLRALP